MKRKSLYGAKPSSFSSGYQSTGLKRRLSEPSFEKKRVEEETYTESSNYDRASLLSMIEQDDMEIERLEKLLGIKKKKKGLSDAAAKLDKEFEKFEGIGDNFGSFLLGLDEMTAGITGKKKEDSESDNDSESDSDSNDSEKDDDIPTDIDTDDEERMDREIEEEIRQDFGSESEEEEEEEEELDSEEEKEKKKEFKADKKDYFKPLKGEDIYGNSLKKKEKNTSKFIQKDDFISYFKSFLSSDSLSSASAATSRYLPPSMKKKLEEEARLNSNSSSQAEEELKKSIINVINKLNGSNKDILLKELVHLYENNSKNLFNKLFLSSILSTFFNTNKILYNFLSISSLILSSFFIIYGNDFNSFYIENIILILREKLNEYCLKLRNYSMEKMNNEDYFTDLKLLKNSILSLVIFITYLYSFRVLNHSIVVDFLKDLIDEAVDFPSSLNELSKEDRIKNSYYFIPPTHISEPQDSSFLYEELRFEIISIILLISNDFLRSDDPSDLKILIQLIIKRLNLIKEEKNKNKEEDDDVDEDEETVSPINLSRLEYFLQMILNIKNNRQHNNKDFLKLDEIKAFRKFLGQVKTNFKNLLQENQIQFQLKDFFTIESKGRWWKLGAMYNNNDESIKKIPTNDIQATTDDILIIKTLLGGDSTEGNSLNSSIVKLIKKLKIKTEFKQNIFYIVMSSRNLYDTYEGLIKLLNFFNNKNSNNKNNERELIRSLIEFNNHEKIFNLYYSELLNQFVESNRQNKITIQYYYWDFIKVLIDDRGSSDDIKRIRQMSNINNLIIYFIKNYSLSLVILKIINIDQLTDDNNNNLIKFLTNFLLHFFNTNVSEEDFIKLIDRLATSKDYYIVKNTFMFFIQKYMVKINKKSILEHQIITDLSDEKNDEILIKINRKKKVLLKVLKDMEILDLTGQNNAEPNGNKKKNKEFENDYDDFN